jgi:predicted RND superfamily exporter protein
MALLTRTFSAVTYSMAKTYIAAFIIITPMMMFLVGSIRMGLLSMIPNLAPILLTLGIMGWAGISLDLFTLLIGCIAIGLAVDDTIHFMHNFRRYYERTHDVGEAVRNTLQSAGQAMLFTSLTLSAGFFIYMLASMGNLVLFGMLTGFTIVMAFISDIVLAPALVTLVVRYTSLHRLPAPEPLPSD